MNISSKFMTHIIPLVVCLYFPGDISSIFTKILILENTISIEKAAEIAKAINLYSKERNISENILLSIMYHESRFKQKARGADGEIGLMQLMPFWKKTKLCRNLDIERSINDNIDCGTRILYLYLDLFEGNIEHSITAYNRGSSTVKAHIRKHKDPIQAYTHIILRTKKKLDDIDSQIIDLQNKD